MLHSAFAEHTDSDLWLLLKQGEIKALETLHACLLYTSDAADE